MAVRKSSTERVRAYRKRMRDKGLRPVVFWLPDVNSPEFIAQAHRESVLMAELDRRDDAQALLDSLFDETHG